MNLNPYLDVAPEVAAAVAAGKPVVALESTIISHGMPYPQNVETALKVFMANGKNIAYVRVSTLEQNEARQREALQPYNIDKWFIEKASGKDTQRPKLQEMLEYIREDDTVYVEEFSRLGRSTADLLATVKQIEDTGAKFISLKENFDTHTPAGKLQMTMMAAIAEFERAMILERQREGIAIAKREGKYKGRKAVSVPNIGEYYQKYMSRQATKTSIAEELGISRTTLDKLFKEHLETQ